MAEPREGNSGARARLTWGRIARRIRVPLGFVLAVFYLWRANPNWQFLAGGAAIVMLGVFLRAVASGHVKKNRELTRTGPYAFVRNPLYLGSVVIASGFALAARDVWIAVAILLLFALIYMPVIRSEETFLRGEFSEYENYARNVPRWLPRKLWFRGLTTGFSRELYWRHHEYNALLGATAMLAALAAKILWVTRTT